MNDRGGSFQQEGGDIYIQRLHNQPSSTSRPKSELHPLWYTPH